MTKHRLALFPVHFRDTVLRSPVPQVQNIDWSRCKPGWSILFLPKHPRAIHRVQAPSSEKKRNLHCDMKNLLQQLVQIKPAFTIEKLPVIHWITTKLLEWEVRVLYGPAFRSQIVHVDGGAFCFFLFHHFFPTILTWNAKYSTHWCSDAPY